MFESRFFNIALLILAIVGGISTVLGWEPIICVSESKKSQWEGIKMHTRDTIIVYYYKIVYINHTSSST